MMSKISKTVDNDNVQRQAVLPVANKMVTAQQLAAIEGSSGVLVSHLTVAKLGKSGYLLDDEPAMEVVVSEGSNRPVVADLSVPYIPPGHTMSNALGGHNIPLLTTPCPNSHPHFLPPSASSPSYLHSSALVPISPPPSHPLPLPVPVGIQIRIPLLNPSLLLPPATPSPTRNSLYELLTAPHHSVSPVAGRAVDGPGQLDTRSRGAKRDRTESESQDKEKVADNVHKVKSRMPRDDTQDIGRQRLVDVGVGMANACAGGGSSPSQPTTTLHQREEITSGPIVVGAGCSSSALQGVQGHDATFNIPVWCNNINGTLEVKGGVVTKRNIGGKNLSIRTDFEGHKGKEDSRFNLIGFEVHCGMGKNKNPYESIMVLEGPESSEMQKKNLGTWISEHRTARSHGPCTRGRQGCKSLSTDEVTATVIELNAGTNSRNDLGAADEATMTTAFPNLPSGGIISMVESAMPAESPALPLGNAVMGAMTHDVTVMEGGQAIIATLSHDLLEISDDEDYEEEDDDEKDKDYVGDEDDDEDEDADCEIMRSTCGGDAEPWVLDMTSDMSHNNIARPILSDGPPVVIDLTANGDKDNADNASQIIPAVGTADITMVDVMQAALEADEKDDGGNVIAGDVIQAALEADEKDDGGNVMAGDVMQAALEADDKDDGGNVMAGDVMQAALEADDKDDGGNVMAGDVMQAAVEADDKDDGGNVMAGDVMQAAVEADDKDDGGNVIAGDVMQAAVEADDKDDGGNVIAGDVMQAAVEADDEDDGTMMETDEMEAAEAMCMLAD
ncbi:hypothetical protein CEUSTIGMA_g10395.t1 [Chlamydomonas eustigma]|uniref:Uncharacterized protein n=1 Tax=Chlamydomonas eustigma TaxID=1157962 RepID=A0A250XIR3_9CHLO|nr:hypothetical protein CEUSTIGMA_g10395.t1 [Chlamydomonas eustigma]|eukprot:GAX82968.1 hypothetical protein CEUSTIGMA_g10395.t1 [Chlamydomonas eustigma]